MSEPRAGKHASGEHGQQRQQLLPQLADVLPLLAVWADAKHGVRGVRGDRGTPPSSGLPGTSLPPNAPRAWLSLSPAVPRAHCPACSLQQLPLAQWRPRTPAASRGAARGLCAVLTGSPPLRLCVDTLSRRGVDTLARAHLPEPTAAECAGRADGEPVRVSFALRDTPSPPRSLRPHGMGVPLFMTPGEFWVQTLTPALHLGAHVSPLPLPSTPHSLPRPRAVRGGEPTGPVPVLAPRRQLEMGSPAAPRGGIRARLTVLPAPDAHIPRPRSQRPHPPGTVMVPVPKVRPLREAAPHPKVTGGSWHAGTHASAGLRSPTAIRPHTLPLPRSGRDRKSPHPPPRL